MRGRNKRGRRFDETGSEMNGTRRTGEGGMKSEDVKTEQQTISGRTDKIKGIISFQKP